jgi:uncharacterized Fe-S radical SAM superfamily protein PflX
MLSSKVTISELKTKFQNIRRRHFGNSSACNKMGNYNPTFDANCYTDYKKSMPSSEITKSETFARFQDDRRRHFVY